MEMKSELHDDDKTKDLGPTFIGIGAQRSGTSWLFECLREHPNVFMPRKETHFFDREYDKGFSYYSGLFTGVENSVATGEFTPDYLYSPEAMERIALHCPNAKLIILLRKPAERTQSALRLLQTHGRMRHTTLEAAIKEAPWILEQSLYSKQVKRVFDLFPRQNVCIRLYDDIPQTPLDLYRGICRFIKIDEGFIPSNIRAVRNATFLPNSFISSYALGLQSLSSKKRLRRVTGLLRRSTTLRRITSKLIRLNVQRLHQSDLPSFVVEKINSDVESLEGLIGMRLEAWKE